MPNNSPFVLNKAPNLIFLDGINGTPYIEKVMNDFYNSFVKKRDEVIRNRMIKLGMNSDDTEFIKENIQRVTFEDDPDYEHFYFHFRQPDELRIISIEKTPAWDNDSQINRSIVSTVVCKYY